MSTGIGQLLRYGVVGVASNVLCYCIYLLLTRWALPPMVAMSLVYALGVLQTFFFNRRWTFRASHGGWHSAFFRYCIAYGFGYVLNLIALYVLVERLTYPHQFVQAIMILVLALMFFLLQKFWIFRSSSMNSSVPSTSI